MTTIEQDKIAEVFDTEMFAEPNPQHLHELSQQQMPSHSMSLDPLDPLHLSGVAKVKLTPEQALKVHGFSNPEAILRARTAAKIGLPLMCAFLMEESGGGRMIYGHDTYESHGVVHRAPGWGWGNVTHANYMAFRHLVSVVGVSNGVGGMQLTSVGLLDQADKAGGAWVPQHNYAIGAHYAHDQIKLHGLTVGVERYNGSGPAAEAYSHRVLALAEHYKNLGLGTVIGILK